MPGAFRFSHVVPIRFSDIDVLGHLNHVAYLNILENGRIAYYYQVMGMTSVHDITFVMADLHIRYLASALFGQSLRVDFRIDWLKRSSSRFAFEIRDQATDALIADGDGIQVYMDLETNRAEPLPERYRQRVLAHEGAPLEPPD